MMNHKRNILLFCMIFAAHVSYCQFSLKKSFQTSFSQKKFFSVQSSFPGNISQRIPENFSATQLGFICKQEWHWENATKIPLRLRIGSVAQCDKLEGKKSLVLNSVAP